MLLLCPRSEHLTLPRPFCGRVDDVSDSPFRLCICKTNFTTERVIGSRRTILLLRFRVLCRLAVFDEQVRKDDSGTLVHLLSFAEVYSREKLSIEVSFASLRFVSDSSDVLNRWFYKWTSN
jgi:hypothetical protein